MNLSQETRDSAMSVANGNTHSMRPRSDSLDIFTMSPLISPSLPNDQDVLVPPPLRLPEPTPLDLDSSASGSKPIGGHERNRSLSPPSTPNSPTSFSFSPPLRSHVPYGGTSYGTDMTSLVGSWSPGVNLDDEPSRSPVDKGKAVERESLSGLHTALETALEKGKGKECDDSQVAFDVDFQQREAVADLSELDHPPVVRLSPGMHYRQYSQNNEPSTGTSLRVDPLPSETEIADVEPVQHPPPSDTSTPSSVPSSEAFSSEEPPRLRFPTHRRSFSSLSIRSIRSSSSRSMASIRSAVSGAGIRNRVKSMTPAAKKLKGGLRKMFRRPEASRSRDVVNGDENDDADSSDDEEPEPRRAFEEASPMRPAHGHVPESSAESYMTVTPAAVSGVVHVPEAVVEHRRIPSPKPRSMSAPLPLPTVEPSCEKGKGVDVEVRPTATVQEAVALPNKFNDKLPRELQLAILRMLLLVHEAEHARAERGDAADAWTVRTACRTRWVGRDKGVRELVKFTRVSKAWQALAFDGQLWRMLHLTSVPPNHLAPALLLRVASHAGRFVHSLDLRGWSHLDPVTLRALVRSLASASSLTPLTPPFPPTNLTHIALRTCTALTANSLHHVLLRAPALRSVDLRGLSAVTNTTCGVLAAYCPRLECADLRRCVNMDGEGLVELVGCGMGRSWTGVEDVFGVVEREEKKGEGLKVLRASGVRHIDEEVMKAFARGAPNLEVLDLSGAAELTDDAVSAFVEWDSSWDDIAAADSVSYRAKVKLTAREMGRDPTVEYGPFFKRITRLRHVNISACPLLTDLACTHLAHCVPNLEFLELAGIGPDLKDDGVVRLLDTTPRLRRLDLEDACDITDDVLDALTPAVEHLTISYALNITNEAFLRLIRRCSRLAVLEADNTRISGAVVREFVRLTRERRLQGAEVVAVDCRAINEALIKDLACAGTTRPRRGFRKYEARSLGYVDRRDGETVGMDVDECDDARVVFKSFWSWQGVDAIRRERERRRRLALTSRRNTDAGETFRRLGLLDDEEEDEFFGADTAGSSTMRPRWLAHWARASSGSSSPTGANDEERGCTIM